MSHNLEQVLEAQRVYESQIDIIKMMKAKNSPAKRQYNMGEAFFMHILELQALEKYNLDVKSLVNGMFQDGTPMNEFGINLEECKDLEKKLDMYNSRMK